MDSKPSQQVANGKHQFGATNSTDVKLRIFGPNREEYEGNPIHLNSQLLQKSDFFKAFLSDRWSSDIRPIEIEVVTCQSFENYIKCIQIMCSSSPIRFFNVDECLAILPVASELLVNNLMQQCMAYLEAVPWNSEQESNIRDLLSSLNLSVLPDLNARLNKPNICYSDIVLANVKEMISFISDGEGAGFYQPNVPEPVGNFIAENLQGDACSKIADMCRHIILEVFKANIAIAVSFKDKDPTDIYTAQVPIKVITAMHVVSWSFNVIECCDSTTMEAALKILCDAVIPADIIPENKKHRETFVRILLGFLEALGNGKIIAERKVRAGFVTTWFPVIAELICIGQFKNPKSMGVTGIEFDCELKNRLCQAVINVMETLPFDDWEDIYRIWIDCCKKYYIDLSIPFAWWCKLLQDPHD